MCWDFEGLWVILGGGLWGFGVVVVFLRGFGWGEFWKFFNGLGAIKEVRSFRRGVNLGGFWGLLLTPPCPPRQLRVSKEQEHFLVAPQGLACSEVTAASLVSPYLPPRGCLGWGAAPELPVPPR